MEFSFTSIGTIRSCFREKFGVPRQAGLVSEARAYIRLNPPYNRPEAMKGLENFSHLWVVFVFHKSPEMKERLTVRPPKLGGAKRVGVFAARANYRPNPIGMSAVKLLRINTEKGRIYVSGGDFLDDTPVVDLKPYLPYADCIEEATGSLTPQSGFKKENIHFSPKALKDLETAEKRRKGLKTLIEQTLVLDPRPGFYKRNNVKDSFGMRLYQFDIRWSLEEETVTVDEIIRAK